MMPAGKYYVGDLCYVMHPEWHEVCDLLDGDEGVYSLKDGRKFACLNTYYGDGVYTSNIGTKHSVDAGVIGCIRVCDIRDEEYTEEHINELGAIINFYEPFFVWNEDGVLCFGQVRIDTKHDEYYEDEE